VLALEGSFMTRFVSAVLPVRLIWALLLGGVALGLGCKVGPDYRTPATTMPAHWDFPATTQASMVTNEPLHLTGWWKQFKDPELNSLVERAVAANLDLLAAKQRIAASRAQVGQAVSGLLPFVDADGSYTRSGGQRLAWGSNWTGTLNSALTIDIFGQVRRQVEQADASYDAALEDRRDVLVTLLGDVASDYITLRGEQQEVAIARENLDVQTHNARLARDKKMLGTGTDLDIAQADAQVSSTSATIESLKASVQQTMYAISVLLALSPDSLNTELSWVVRVPDPPAEVPVGLPSDLLRRRPDIRRSERQLAAANAGIGVAVGDLFPKFSLTGDVGLSARRIDLASNWNNSFWSFGPGVTWSVLDSGRIVSNIQQQGAITDQAVTAYRKAVLNALLEVQTVLISYAAEQHRRVALEQAVAANQMAVKLATRRYDQGLTDFLAVLDAERTLYAAQDSLVLSNQAVGTDAVALYRALGGGWEIDPEVATTQRVDH
jgi:NodT family efflux transporter outer membrane factor (OMF) lipoprotein